MMKIFIIRGDLFIQKGDRVRLVNSNTMAAFTTKEKAQAYILETWPDVSRLANDEDGIAYRLDLEDGWFGKYHIDELELET